MKKRLVALVLAAFMVFSLTSCSGSNSSSAGSSAAGGSGSSAPTQLTYAFITMGKTPADLTSVQNAINKITLKKINATVKLVPIGIANYSQQINLMLTSHEDLDLFTTGNLGNVLQFAAQAPQGKLLALDDLLDKYGSGIKSAVDPEYLLGGKVNGKVYAIPTLRDEAIYNSFNVPKDLVDKYKIDLSGIKMNDDIFTTLDEIEAVLKQFHAACPSVSPFGYGNGMDFTDAFEFAKGDPLGDTQTKYGVLLDNQKLDVTDYYNSSEYSKMLAVSRKWFQEGLIDKTSATSSQNAYEMIKAGKLFSDCEAAKPGVEEVLKTNCGKDMICIPIYKQRTTSQTVTGFMLGIPSYTKNAVKAVQFLNLMYSDKDIVNLFCWGIEGKHYVKTSTPNIIDYPSGVNANNDGWGLNSGFEFGDQLLSYIWKGDKPTLWQDMKKFNDAGIKSKALGFSFDTSPVKTEYSAVTNVTTQYREALNNGVLDPATTLPKFQQALKAAGLDKVVSEKAAQLKKWAATNSK